MANKPIPRAAVLVTRRQAAELLGGCTISHLSQLEADGSLTPVRLRPKKNSHVLYRVEEIEKLIGAPVHPKIERKRLKEDA